MRRSSSLAAYRKDPAEGTFVFTKKRNFLKPLRVKATGVRILHDPIFNKGTAFDYVERDVLRLRGLLPPCHRTLEEQTKRCMDFLDTLKGPVQKNLYLQDLQNRNETLYFKLLMENIAEMAPVRSFHPQIIYFTHIL